MRDYLDNEQRCQREAFENKLVLQSYPKVVTLGLTVRCNIDCVMCNARPFKQIDMPGNVLEKIQPILGHASEIAWSEAGEFFASDDVESYFDMIQRYRPRISRFSTNFLGAGKYIDKLFTCGLTEISVSIDAATRETYESIRVGGSWSQLIENLERFNQIKREKKQIYPFLAFYFVAMRRNIEELHHIVDFAREFQAWRIAVLRLCPTNDETFNNKESIDDKSAHPCFVKAIEKASEAGIMLQDGYYCNNWANLRSCGTCDMTTAEEDCKPSYKHKINNAFPKTFPESPKCLVPWTEFLVQTNGKVRPGGYRPQIMGDLRKQSFWEVWNGPKFQEFRQQIILGDFSLCTGCPCLEHFSRKSDLPIVPHYQVFYNRVSETITQGVERMDKLENSLAVDHLDVKTRRHFINDMYRNIISKRRKSNGNKRDICNNRIEEITGARKSLQDIQNTLDRMCLFASKYELLHEQQRELFLECLNRVAKEAYSNQVIRRLNGDDLFYKDIDSLFYNVRFISHSTPHHMEAGRQYLVNLELFNLSTINWPVAEDVADQNVINLSYSWYSKYNTVIERDGLRTIIPMTNGPLKVFQVKATLESYHIPGEYILVWDLVHEGHTWFKDRGSLPLQVSITIH